MITYLKHDQIDKTLWDDCLTHAANGQVYAWSWYLDIVHPGWEALVEVRDGNYHSIMPLTSKKKYFIPYLCQPFFVQQLGVFSRDAVKPETTVDFLQAIPKKFRLVEIRLNEQNPLPEAYKGIDYHQNHLLDLHQDYQCLLSNYHENTKRNLKKALKNDLEVSLLSDIGTVIKLFREDRGASVHHWGDAEYARLERLSCAALSLSNAFIYGVQSIDSDEIICGALFMKCLGRITFLFSGNSEIGKSKQAMTCLIDHVIAEYSGKPFILDFEGSDDPNLARYYQGFGSKTIHYPSYSYRWISPV